MKAKTKYKVEIHAYGSENENLLKAIANHNSGRATISLVDIRGYTAIKTANYPTIEVKANWSKTEDSTIQIVDNGIHTLTIQQIELTEFVEASDPDDIKNIL